MQKAALSTQGLFQSVRLPQGFHLQGDEVYLKRAGKSVLLIPQDANLWDLMEDSLEQFTDDFMLNRNQPADQKREDLTA